jgi:hypothetical protein
VPSVAFGAAFHPTKERGANRGTIFMGVERGGGGGNAAKGKNKRVQTVSFYQFRVKCPSGWRTTIQTELYEPITGDTLRNEIAIDAKVRHRRWRFNDLVLDAVGHGSNELIDATINFRGKFRKHNKDRADGTLEVTLEGGATYLYPSGTPPIVTEWPLFWDSGPEDCHGKKDFHLHRLTDKER